jgi:hypothetical protein
MTMTHPLAAEAAQALQGVTEGPWAVCGDGTRVKPIPFDMFFRPIAETSAELHWEDGNWVRKDDGQANASFIAFARAWVPEAAAALTALSAEAAALAAQVAELTAERDEALSAARQQDKLREATLGTLRSVSAALEAAEAKVAQASEELSLIAVMGYSDDPKVAANIARMAVERATKARAALTEGDTNG